MQIRKRVQEQIKFESYLPEKLFEKMDELRKEGYSFERVQNYLDDSNQRMHYVIGTKETDWVKEE